MFHPFFFSASGWSTESPHSMGFYSCLHMHATVSGSQSCAETFFSLAAEYWPTPCGNRVRCFQWLSMLWWWFEMLSIESMVCNTVEMVWDAFNSVVVWEVFNGLQCCGDDVKHFEWLAMLWWWCETLWMACNVVVMLWNPLNGLQCCGDDVKHLQWLVMMWWCETFSVACHAVVMMWNTLSGLMACQAVVMMWNTFSGLMACQAVVMTWNTVSGLMACQAVVMTWNTVSGLMACQAVVMMWNTFSGLQSL